MISRIIATTLIFILSNAVHLQGKKLTAEEQLQQTANDFIKKSFEFDPVYATSMGDHSLDNRYPDFSQRALGRMVSALKEIRSRVAQINPSSLKTDDKIDHLLLSSNIESQILVLSRSLLMQDNPKVFSSSAVDGIYQIILSQSLSDSTKLESIMKRIEDLPRFLKSAEKSLKQPPQIWVLLAEQEADNGVNFFNDVAENFIAIFPGRERDIKQRFAKAVNALEDYSEFLDNFKGKDGAPFAVGKEIFDRMLKNDFFLEFGADSLLKIGESLFAAAAKDYDSVAAVVSSLPPVEEGDYYIPRSFTRDDVLDYFQWEINQNRKWIVDHEFVTVPNTIGECIPVETPKFLRNVIGAIAYQPPGPFETVQTGRFYVRPVPDSLDEENQSAFFRYCYKRGFRSSSVHEAYPGHHLQMSVGNTNPSLIRRIQHNNMMIEGWALYCEQEMYQQGFYGDDPRTYLGVLGGVRFRAARIIVDVKLHTGQFTYQQAVDWMVENLNASVEYIEKEVNRYTLTPTQPMTYLMGKREILRIRDAYQKKAEQKFTLKRFHDLLLGEGSISPVLIYKKLTGEIL